MKTLQISIIAILLLLTNAVNAQEAKGKKDKSVETVTILTTSECEQCKERIEKNMAYEKGVKYVSLDLETKKLTVKFRKDKTDIHKIRKAISDIGYDADDVKANPEAYEKLPACCKVGGHDHEKQNK
jgi:copper chaperone CopZ